MTTNTSIIIHPIFEECKKFTLDKYWQDIFTSCACNKFPPGMRFDPIKKGVSIKTFDMKKPETITLPQEPSACFQLLLNIFKNKLDLRSSRDIQLEHEHIEELKQKKKTELCCEWKKIKRNLKEQFLMAYVEKLKAEHVLMLPEIKQLIATIHIGFQFKSLVSDDVEYKNGEILCISGLEFNDTNRRFYTTRQTTAVHKPDKGLSTGIFYQNMEKFIRDQNARLEKLI